MSSPSPSPERQNESRQESDLFHDALADLEARGVPRHRPLTDAERNLLVQRLIDGSVGEIIERGVRAAGIRPGDPQDAFSDLVQEGWVKCLDLLSGLSLEQVRARFADHGQFAGTVWIAAKNRTRDHHRSQSRASERFVPLIVGVEEEEGVTEEALLPESRHSAPGATYENLDLLIDCRYALSELKARAMRTSSPQGRKSLPRLLALMDMDFGRVIQDGRLPDTDEVCEELGFPSASTVSQARRRYRQMARECFEGLSGDSSSPLN